MSISQYMRTGAQNMMTRSFLINSSFQDIDFFFLKISTTNKRFIPLSEHITFDRVVFDAAKPVYFQLAHFTQVCRERRIRDDAP